MLKKNELVRLEVIDYTSQGQGVGKCGNFVVFVPGTVPGDLIQAKMVKVLKQYGYGILDQILRPSADRILSDCPHDRLCGGCSMRQMTYERELSLKHKWVSDSFQRLGQIGCSVEPILGAPAQSGYRNKVQLPLEMRDGKPLCGFFAPRSHRVVPCDGCLLEPPEFGPILQTLLDFVRQYHISIYRAAAGQGLVRHFYLRRAQETGEIMVCLVCTKPDLPHADVLVERLLSCNPHIVSIVLNHNPDQTNVILGRQEITLYGKDTITDRLCGLSVTLSPQSFYQVNHDQAERLYAMAQDMAGLTGNETLLDLYCGVGAIGLSMAGHIKRLFGVDVVEPAIENARRNAEQNHIANAAFLCMDAAEAAKQLLEQGIRPDIVVVDPPRKGCSIQTIQTMVELAPPRIVMVSCNPSTAARDCGLLQRYGYQVQRIAPIDLFPRTLHVETVILLSKK